MPNECDVENPCWRLPRGLARPARAIGAYGCDKPAVFLSVGLRDYGTGLWEGGDEACNHKGPPAASATASTLKNDGRPRDRVGQNNYERQAGAVYRDVCGKCGATRVDKQIGLEPTPDEFVGALVGVFREVRRVLRDDGTVWLNLGDSYASSGQSGMQSPTARLGVGTDGTVRMAGGVPGANPKMAGQVFGRAPTPDGTKPKDLLGIPWMVAFALRADGWYLRSEIIWCLSGGTRVYAKTQKGEMPMSIKDLVRLDPSTVQLWNGEKWTQVLGWGRSDEPRTGAVEVVLRSGERIGCTPGHVWPTQRGNVRTDELVVGDIIQTCRLPNPRDHFAPAHVSESVAWLAGLYLAEGSTDTRGRMQLAGHASESLDRLGRLDGCVRAFGGIMNQYGSGNAHTITIDCPPLVAIVKQYIHGTTAKTKGIKVRAWRHHDSWLRALLDGYLAGDGHYDAGNERWRLGFTRNDRLAADLRTLAARLGCVLTLNATHANGFGERWATYRGELRFEHSEHHNVKDRGEVVALRRSRGREFWDIAVADDPHLFALASGVLTHNCKPNPMPESVSDRPTKAHEQIFLLSKMPRYYFDADAIREDHKGGSGWEESHANKPTPNGLGNGELAQHTRMGDHPAGRNKRSVWTVATQPYAGAHFATFPPKLIEPCILAGCPERCCGVCGAPWERIVERTAMVVRPTQKRADWQAENDHARTQTGGTMLEAPTSRTIGFEPSCGHNAEPTPGTVLDPFAGAGTTGMVALRHNRSFVGIELNEEYAQMARYRIIDDCPLHNSGLERNSFMRRGLTHAERSTKVDKEGA